MCGKGDDFFSENQRKGGNVKISVRDRGYEMNSMDKHEVHLVVGLQAPGCQPSHKDCLYFNHDLMLSAFYII